MNALVQEILSGFDSLPNSEPIEVAVEILKRVVKVDFPPLTDKDLALKAEELFLALDHQEAEYERSCTGI